MLFFILDCPETDFKELDTLDPVAEAENLKQQFRVLLMSILQSMGQVDLDILKLRITWYFNSENVIAPEIQEVLDELQLLTTPQRILNFLLIRKFIGYLNYELIKAFQNAVNSDETKTKIEEYERKYDAFLCQFSFNTIIEAFKNRADLAPVSIIGLPKFIVQLKQSWEGKTVYTWKDIWENMFTWPPSLIIVGMERSYIVMTYTVLPFFIPSVVRDLEDSDIMNELENAGVSVELSTDLIKFGRQDDGDWINEKEVAGKNEIPSTNGGSNTTQVVRDASNSFDLDGRKYDPQILVSYMKYNLFINL